MRAGKAEKGIVIRSFGLQPEDEPQSQRMRFRLLVQQSGKAERDFAGSVQLEVRFTQKGGSFVSEIPESEATPERNKAFELSFRHYQRLAGNRMCPAREVGP